MNHWPAEQAPLNEWSRIPTCLDYQAFVRAVPTDLSDAAYHRLTEALRDMGRVKQELLGVIYIEAAWGVVVIPPAGFPEIRINFYHATDQAQVERILRGVARLLRTAIHENSSSHAN